MHEWEVGDRGFECPQLSFFVLGKMANCFECLSALPCSEFTCVSDIHSSFGSRAILPSDIEGTLHTMYI